MHQAPAVNFVVTRSRVLLIFLMFVCTAAVSASVAFTSVQGGDASLRVVGIWACTALSVFCALRGWLRSPCGSLRWDGASWYWREQPTDPPAMRMDWQRMLFVSLSHQGAPTQWLCLHHESTDQRSWLSIRRALIATQHGESS